MSSNHSHSHSFVRLSNLFMENSSNSKAIMEDNESTTTADQLDELPGFRFHPTEEELLEFYLKNILLGKKLHYDIIGFLNIYHHDPWELPGLAKIGEREWYFFVPRDRKHGNGGRPNRTTKTGFWKATGSDRKILSLSNPKKMIGLKKTLVFYKGRAPRGCKTDWIMNEYRHPDTSNFKDVVLCKIYRKATSLRVLEQRAAIEEEEAAAAKAFHIADTNTTTKTNYEYPSSASPPTDSVSSCSTHVGDDFALSSINHAVLKKEAEELLGLIGNELQVFDNNNNNNNNKGFSSRTISSSSSSFSSSSSSSGSGDLLQKGKLNLGELQVPAKYDNMEWIQDPLWTQLRSPWLDNILTPGLSYANLLNF